LIEDDELVAERRGDRDAGRKGTEFARRARAAAAVAVIGQPFLPEVFLVSHHEFVVAAVAKYGLPGDLFSCSISA